MPGEQDCREPLRRRAADRTLDAPVRGARSRAVTIRLTRTSHIYPDRLNHSRRSILKAPAAAAAMAGGHCSWRIRCTSIARILGVVLALRWSLTRVLLSDGTERVVTPILSKETRVNNVIGNHS